jgi:hypothetical protein
MTMDDDFAAPNQAAMRRSTVSLEKRSLAGGFDWFVDIADQAAREAQAHEGPDFLLDYHDVLRPALFYLALSGRFRSALLGHLAQDVPVRERA